jgi:N-acyl-D-aspartate/D-glutamate deacylase
MIAGMQNRGLVGRGYHADLVMFDPARIALGKKRIVRDLPGSGERWQVRPEGIHRVIVNGEVVVEHGELTGSRPGKVLRIGNPKEGA